MADTVIFDDRPKGRLEARAEGELLGHIQYFVLDDPAPALVPVHTVVEPAHEGKGVAGSLTRELYAIAAREGFAVAPLCPYVVRWAAKHPDEAPVAPQELLDAAKAAVEADPEKW
ncbi:N-acetyltransferase [Streptomyces sp. YC504]|uniref:N-acetyltransferase n=1 Tax=Streptomyces mesophilus TaxID=1775132 RepID=A0A6G4XYH7_9ACTN|nr:GNAT family N-acetyltransferase [Streptomyces mesophilus]NGO81820.1 N-acetyltransferase [Streptomyces mesophilus]